MRPLPVGAAPGYPRPMERSDPMAGGPAGRHDEEEPLGATEFVAVSLDDLAAFRAAILLAEESLGRALRAVERYEGNGSHLAQELGSALEALATTDDDLRRATARADGEGRDPAG